MALDEAQIRENCKRVQSRISEACARWRKSGDTVDLMAVTKTVPPELVNVAVDCGIRLLGENRVQEYLAKKDIYAPEAEVQFIGRVQTNKLKFLIPSVTCIQAVDSLHTAEEINKHAQKHGITQKILLEVNIGGEESKGGISALALPALLESVRALDAVSVCGLMTIPPPGDSERCFAAMQELFEKTAQSCPGLTTLSMGMSGDFETAIRYGATVVRIGSGLFGARN